MVKKKTTKEIRAIDRIIKFQIDDGIESLTIAGKEALADLEIDNKNNVTLYLNADKDKINELNSLVPFINLAVKEEGVDPDRTKSVTLSQDLTQFALEIADNSKELSSLIKTESSIILDLDGLVKKLLEIAGKLAELEAKDLEQDNRLTEIETKDLEQDNRLTELETKDLEQDNRLTELESKEQTQEQLYNVSTHTLVHNFSNGMQSITIVVKEKNEDGKVFGHLTFKYINDEGMKIVHTIPLSQVNGFDYYVLEYDGYHYDVSNLILSEETLESGGYTITVNTLERSPISSLVLNSVLYKETPNTDNEHIVTLIENGGAN